MVDRFLREYLPYETEVKKCLFAVGRVGKKEWTAGPASQRPERHENRREDRHRQQSAL